MRAADPSVLLNLIARPSRVAYDLNVVTLALVLVVKMPIVLQ